MPEIAPFRGYRYNPETVDLHAVVAPPYDVISPELQARLYEKSPYNVVRLILGREENRYASAAEAFQQWQKEGVLRRDAKPALYLLHQLFDGPEGSTVKRKGFVAVCRLEEFDKQIVLPHEKTLSEPREDRLKLFTATNSNFSQIFCLYSDPEKYIDRSLNGSAKSNPEIDVTFEGVQNKLWPVTEESVIGDVRKVLSSKQVLIADGHHRYETALAFRDQVRSANPAHTGNEPYNFVMMFFTNVDDEGLAIYPTHRLVHSLTGFDAGRFLKKAGEYFIIREFDDPASLLSALESSSVPSFGLQLAGERVTRLLSLKPVRPAGEILQDTLPPEVRELDVTLLHFAILRDMLGISMEAQEAKRNLEYVRDFSEALNAVKSGKAQLAFLMNATKIQQVRSVARAGHTMPQKSTYFHPKLLSGLVLNRLDSW